jgi:ribosomal protein S18 acetylase RimI-like enzyme
MAPAVTIRPARLEDVPELARIQVDTWRSTYKGLIDQNYLDSLSYSDKEQNLAKGISLNYPTTVRLVALLDNVIAGFVIAGSKRGDDWPHTSEMYALYVAENVQGLGAGSALYKEAAEWLRHAGHSGMIIRVLKGNDKSIKFYGSRGARLIGDEPLMLEGIEYNELVFEQKLSPAG